MGTITGQDLNNLSVEQLEELQQAITDKLNETITEDEEDVEDEKPSLDNIPEDDDRILNLRDLVAQHFCWLRIPVDTELNIRVKIKGTVREELYLQEHYEKDQIRLSQTHNEIDMSEVQLIVECPEFPDLAEKIEMELQDEWIYGIFEVEELGNRNVQLEKIRTLIPKAKEIIDNIMEEYDTTYEEALELAYDKAWQELGI